MPRRPRTRTHDGMTDPGVADSAPVLPDHLEAPMSKLTVVTATSVEAMDVVAWARNYARVVLALYRERETRVA